MSPFRNDLDAAHSRISSLEDQNRELIEKLKLKPKPKKPEKEKKVKCTECGGPFRAMGQVVAGAVIGLVVAGLFVWVMSLVITERGPKGCYIKGDGLVFKLKRTVDWGEDTVVGSYRSMDEALADAAKIKCEIE